jgi:hypothetical protein
MDAKKTTQPQIIRLPELILTRTLLSSMNGNGLDKPHSLALHLGPKPWLHWVGYSGPNIAPKEQGPLRRRSGGVTAQPPNVSLVWLLWDSESCKLPVAGVASSPPPAWALSPQPRPSVAGAFLLGCLVKEESAAALGLNGRNFHPASAVFALDANDGADREGPKARGRMRRVSPLRERSRSSANLR